MNPFVNPKRDVRLEVMLICEAFFGMEPYVDSFWRVFSGRALSERKTLRTTPVGGFTLAAAQVG